MLKRSVIAADITNLTDARYFASWGVDYLMYDLRNIDIPQILEISSWVEGIKTLIYFDQANVHLLDEILIKIKPFATGTSDTFVLDKILIYNNEGLVFFHHKEDEMIILTKSEYINPNSYQIDPESNPISFAEIEPTHAILKDFISNSESTGLVIRGSYEIETGMKSFENVDGLLELLEVEN